MQSWHLWVTSKIQYVLKMQKLIFNLFFRDEGRDYNFGITLTNIQPKIHKTEEILIFSGYDMIASIGGYLGLYLGASILTLHHLLTKIVDKVYLK